MTSLCKEDGHIISILETPTQFLTPDLGTSCHHSQLPLHRPHQIQLMEKGIWNSLVGKSDYLMGYLTGYLMGYLTGYLMGYLIGYLMGVPNRLLIGYLTG